MREMTRYGLILAIICAAASASLAGMNSLTRDRIAAQAKAEEEEGLKAVFPEAADFKPVKSKEKVVYYQAYGRDGGFLGAAFKARGKGYSSVIEVIAGMKKDGTITAIKILNQNETPGLGNRVAEPEFRERFSNKRIVDLNGIQAITGATISSKAVINAVKVKANQVKELIGDEK
ncbi:MAG: hypothetical protein A3G38_01035 [Omnitrophica WOR_2 bacterium RIFCSPLOWO2_12_FULL_51_8]|nr:MAG: hypothetical protein A3G38_01035 [Omnitrophica WOR_2 bacterium RIFCSPLOWO2_12_FULL_51_8]